MFFLSLIHITTADTRLRMTWDPLSPSTSWKGSQTHLAGPSLPQSQSYPIEHFKAGREVIYLV